MKPIGILITESHPIIEHAYLSKAPERILFIAMFIYFSIKRCIKNIKRESQEKLISQHFLAFVYFQTLIWECY